MTETIQLFRADRKGNKTLPERFATDGLLSKQLNGGDPFFYKNYGWIKVIKNHIEKTSDKESIFLYETTSFLSFSTNEKLVRDMYLKGKNNKKYTSSSYNDSEAYIFLASFDFERLQMLSDGIYYYDYRCNYDRFKENIISPLNGSIGCNICEHNPDYKHRLLIINAITFLSNLVMQSDEFLTAYENAKRDSEWLLMPLDPMRDGIGYQSRIAVANFWNVEYFKYLT